MKIIYSLFGLLMLILFSSSSLSAVKPIKNTPVKQETTKDLTKKQAKKLDKLEKRVTKRMEKMNAKANAGVDFDDPTDKWLWYAIFSFGLALVAIILATIALGTTFGVIAGLLSLFSFISIIIWLVKKFG